MTETPMAIKDQWSAHLEYLKVAITVSVAILGVSAAIYADASKIPNDVSRFFLLASALFVFLTLSTSIMALVELSNLFIGKPKGRRVTVWAGGSFFSMIIAALFILIFFVIKTFSNPYSISKAQEDDLAAAKALVTAQINPSAQVELTKFKIANELYLLEYKTGAAQIYSGLYDPRSHILLSLQKQ